MENTGNGAPAPGKKDAAFTEGNSTSSPPPARRNTASVSLDDRLAILMSAANALVPYGIEVGASQLYVEGRRVVAIYLAGNVQFSGGKLVPEETPL